MVIQAAGFSGTEKLRAIVEVICAVASFWSQVGSGCIEQGSQDLAVGGAGSPRPFEGYLGSARNQGSSPQTYADSTSAAFALSLLYPPEELFGPAF